MHAYIMYPCNDRDVQWLVYINEKACILASVVMLIIQFSV